MNNDATSQNQVQDAEIIEIPVPSMPGEGSAEVVLSLESLIKQHVTGIDKRKEDLKQLREMANNVLANDSTYQEHERIAKEAAKVKNATKAQLVKQPSVASAMQKTKILSTEIKEMEDALSDYLKEYGRLTGTNEIETDDGTVREIIYKAKLIKKSTIQQR